MGRVAGKVAFVTGASRGQGRSHAVRLAEEGADIIGVAACRDIATVPIPASTEEDLAETARLVGRTGRRMLATPADVRDLAALQGVVAQGLAEFGRIDIVVANAGIGGAAPVLDLTQEQWRDMVDVTLTGTWNTIKAAVPAIADAGRGGSVVCISSVAALKPMPTIAHYVAAKQGVIGLARTAAKELAGQSIRVNVICPGTVATPLQLNDYTYRLFRPDLAEPTLDDAVQAFRTLQPMPIPWLEPVDVSNAVLFLASDEARYVTGAVLPVDGGASL